MGPLTRRGTHGEDSGPHGAGVLLTGLIAVALAPVTAAPLLLAWVVVGRNPHGEAARFLARGDESGLFVDGGGYVVLTQFLREDLWARVALPLAGLALLGLVSLVVAFALRGLQRRRGDAATASSRRSMRAVMVGGIALLGVGLVAVTVQYLVRGDEGSLVAGGSGSFTDPGVVISEFSSSNGSTIVAPDGEHWDWIELHNPTDVRAQLRGFHLSDREDDPGRWALPDVAIEPGGHLLVWASGRDDHAGEDGLHANFRIARDGEPLLFVAPDGETVLDRMEATFVPRDASFGRDPADPSRTCWFHLPTPGEPNGEVCHDDPSMGPPTLSVPSGVHRDAFTLSIEADTGEEIIYTLDGSYPDLETNGDRTHVHRGPILVEDRSGEPNRLSTIDTGLDPDRTSGTPPSVMPRLEAPIEKATVVRARTPSGAESVATYFVGPQFERDRLPFVSLILNEEYLFDHDVGIYVAGRLSDENHASDDPVRAWSGPANYMGRGRAWERPFADDLRPGVVFEYCPRPTEGCPFQSRVGVRIHGGAGRAFHQKALRIYARNDYGNRTLEHDFFGPGHPTEHRRLLLRASGQDAVRLMFADAYLQRLMVDFQAETQADQPVVLFINGEYWGIHNLRERYDHHYVAVTHGADPEAVEVVDGGPVLTESGAELLDFMLTNDMSTPSALQRVERDLDLDSLFDFLVAHVFTANTDWPGNNVRMWREVDGPQAVGEGVRDGRWRWMIFDLDAVGDWGATDAEFDVFSDGLAETDDPQHLWGLPTLFNRLMDNEEARDRFVTRFADHLNTVFHPDHAHAVLDLVVSELEPEIETHLDRWQTLEVSGWQSWIEVLREFMELRPDVQRQQIVERFGLDDVASVTVAVDPGQGLARVNSLVIDTPTPGVTDAARWTGWYFAGVPVTVEVTPLAGHRFVAWEGLPAGVDASEERVTFVPTGDVVVRAVLATDDG